MAVVDSGNGKGVLARAGRAGSRVERSKGLKDAEGLGCLFAVGGAPDVATPNEDDALPLQKLHTKTVCII